MANKKEAHIDEQMAEAAEVTAEENVAVDGVDGSEESASVEPVQLQINDLQGLGAIINLAFKRGAFEANEAEAIGTAYNKLNAFLGYVAAQQSVAKGEEGETAPTAETE